MIYNIKFLTRLLKNEIFKNWPKTLIPEKDKLLNKEINSFLFDDLEIKGWLLGNDYECIVGSNDSESLMPFYYLSDHAKNYYLAGYLLECIRILENDPTDIANSFAFDHILDFLSNNDSLVFRNTISDDQRCLVKSIFELIFILEKNIPLEVEEVSKINAIIKDSW